MTRQVAVGVREIKSGVTDELLSKAVTADLAFHMVILRESGNPFVIKIVSDLHLMGRIWGGDRNDPLDSDLKLWAKTWKQHNRIYRAIRRRDAEQASYWMTQHLRDATREALAYYDRQCRSQGADQVGFEWPQVVRDAISRLEQFGPENLT